MADTHRERDAHTTSDPARKKARTVARPVQAASRQTTTHHHPHHHAQGSKRTTRRPPQFVNEGTVPWMRVPDDMYGPTFDRADALSWQSTGRRKMLSSHALDGAPLPKLGCSLCELEPGNTMWPFHYHLGSNEAIYILCGSGTMRWGFPESKMVPVTEGDFIAMPPGPEYAHQLTNTGQSVLRYMCMDSKAHPDMTVLPDSQKYGVVAALPRSDGRAHHLHTAFFNVADAKPFFDGEDDFGKIHFGHDAGRVHASTENVYVLGGMKEVENEAMACGMVRPPHRHEPYRNFGHKKHHPA